MRDLISQEEHQHYHQKSNLHGWRSVATTWGIIFLVFTLVRYELNIFTVFIALILLGGRQLALAILMHDASHGTLFKSKQLNEWVGTYLAAIPIGQDFFRYREHHRKHHLFSMTDKDPDLDLTEGLPYTKISWVRKILRDLFFITGIKRLYGQFLMDFALIDYTASSRIVPIDLNRYTLGERLMIGLPRMLKVVTFQLLLFSLCYWLFSWQGYLLWCLSYLSTYSLILRVRSLAEHSQISSKMTGQWHTRTTKANIFARLTVAPHYVNYHLEHHLFMQIPPQNLPQLHRRLNSQKQVPSECYCPNYYEVLKRTLQVIS